MIVNDSTGAAAIVDDHLLAGRIADFLENYACDDVGPAARRPRHDQPYRPRGIVLRIDSVYKHDRQRQGEQPFDCSVHPSPLAIFLPAADIVSLDARLMEFRIRSRLPT